MKHQVNFTPGPSQLYFTVADHARHAFKEGIPSISHRSKQFEQFSREATDGLRELLKVPADYHIFFYRICHRNLGTDLSKPGGRNFFSSC